MRNKKGRFIKGSRSSIKTEFKKGFHYSSTNEFKKGYIPWNKGKRGLRICSEKTKKLMRKVKLGKNNNFFGKCHTDETKEKMSIMRQGEKSHNWQGGKSFEPYSPLFTQQLRDKIRVRDNFKCQLCRVPELELNKRLDIHHIDYDKKNCSENNLISLCHKCHMKSNKNREYWKSYLPIKLKEGILC